MFALSTNIGHFWVRNQNTNRVRLHHGWLYPQGVKLNIQWWCQWQNKWFVYPQEKQFHSEWWWNWIVSSLILKLFKMWRIKLDIKIEMLLKKRNIAVWHKMTQKLWTYKMIINFMNSWCLWSYTKSLISLFLKSISNLIAGLLVTPKQ